MKDDSRLASFEATVLVHLDAAYGLARWLTGDEASAQDAVQEACIKALRAFDSRTGPSARAWFMAVVRNACLDALRAGKRRATDEAFEDETHGAQGGASETPETAAVRASEARWLRAEIARLPLDYREVLVLRELEDLSYKEISAIVKVPIGTVMSRLARGRDLLAERVRAAERRKPG